MAPLLPLIERLSLYPAETLLAVPMPPEQAVRGVLVLRGIARQLETEAEALRARTGAGRPPLQAELNARDAAAGGGAGGPGRRPAGLDSQIAAARGNRAGGRGCRRPTPPAAPRPRPRAPIRCAPRSPQIEAERRAAEARAKAEADAADRQKRRPPRPQAARAGRRRWPARPALASARRAAQLTAPVAGSVCAASATRPRRGRRPASPTRRRRAARVVSPCGGRVVFAGPFRSFGQLLIVDCGGGYHFVLSGFDRLDAQVGQSVQAGEPVGVMPAWDPRRRRTARSLYVELRRDGQPVNPAPWLRAQRLNSAPVDTWQVDSA